MVQQGIPTNVEYNVVKHEVEDFFDSADEIIGIMDEPFHSPNILSIQRIWQDMRDARDPCHDQGRRWRRTLRRLPGRVPQRVSLVLAQKRPTR